LRKKSKKKNKKGHNNCQAPQIETARSFSRVREEGERKRCSLACLSHSSRKCVYVSAAQRRWTKEALTGG